MPINVTITGSEEVEETEPSTIKVKIKKADSEGIPEKEDGVKIARLLEYLRRNGLIEIDSIQGGNIYGSLEGKLQEGKKTVEVTLMKISEWMESEEPMMSGRTGYDDMQDDHLLSPDGEFSTELGEVPHEEEKGSIRQHNLFAPYLYGRYTYE